LSMYTYFTLNLNKFFTDHNSSQASTPAKVLTANALQAYNFFQLESSLTKKYENPPAPILSDHNEGYKFFIAQFWPTFMDFFVLVFNKSSTRTLVEASLACIYNLFELSIAYEFEDAKSTIIVNIVQMTNVISEQSFKNLKDRSLLALLLIFKIIFRKGDFLMDSWTEIFKCLSVLNIYEMPFIYPKFDFDSLLSEYIRSLSIFSKNSSLRFYELGTIRAYFETLIDVYDENEDPKSSLMLTMFKCMISYVFECSNDLNNESLIKMLKSLSVASILELNLRTPKIKFMKHVSDVFISSWDRDDETIKSLWSSFSSVYRYASEVNDEFISIFALNSFRQFLMTTISSEKQCMTEIRFDLMNTLNELINSSSKSVSKADFILSSTYSIISNHSSQLDTSWLPVVYIFNTLLSNNDIAYDKVRQSSFLNFQEIVLKQHFSLQSSPIIVENFSLITQALIDYLFSEDNLKCANDVLKIIYKLLDVDILAKLEVSDKEKWEKVFIPVLYMISQSTFHNDVNVSTHMFDNFFTLSLKHLSLSQKFSVDLYDLLEYMVSPPKSVEMTQYTRETRENCVEYILEQLIARWVELKPILNDQAEKLVQMLLDQMTTLRNDMATNMCLNFCKVAFENADEESGFQDFIIMKLAKCIEQSDSIILNSTSETRNFFKNLKNVILKSILSLIFKNKYCKDINRLTINYYNSIQPFTAALRDSVYKVQQPIRTIGQNVSDEIMKMCRPLTEFTDTTLMDDDAHTLLSYIYSIRIVHLILLYQFVNDKSQENFDALTQFINSQFTTLLKVLVSESQMSLNRRFLKTYMMMIYTAKHFITEKQFLSQTRQTYLIVCELCSYSKAKAMSIACCDYLKEYQVFVTSSTAES